MRPATGLTRRAGEMGDGEAREIELTVDSGNDDGRCSTGKTCVPQLAVSDVGPLFWWERWVGLEVVFGRGRSVDEVPAAVVLRQPELDEKGGDGELAEHWHRKE